MKRYLLDTNIISEPTRPHPSPSLLNWLAVQADEDLFISSMSIAEVRRGILCLPRGRKRARLEAWYDSPAGPAQVFGSRLLAFDEKAALQWASFMAEGDMLGRPRSPLDMIIAAIAAAHDCILVSGNERHFRGVVDVINPLVGSVTAG